jgi:1-acyl-sn-glycerol-3-phosphate acyltransferase
MFFNFFKGLAWIIMHILFRFKVTGRENVPGDGACLVCANHISVFDPVALALHMKRKPRFMAKKELFSPAILNWFWRKLGAYPIDRKASADLVAFRTTMDALKIGHCVMIFSQGTRMKDFDNAKSGVAVFALKTGAPIIPVGISGKFRPFSTVRIRFGKPISMEEYAGQKVKTELVEKVMANVVGHVTKLVEGETP